MNYANGTRNVDWLTKIKLEGISIFAKVSSENANLKYQRKKLCYVCVVQLTGAGIGRNSMHPMCITCNKRTVALKWAKEHDTISTKFCSFDYFDVESLSKKFGIY